MKSKATDIAKGLLEKIREVYYTRVPHARIYSELVRRKNGKVIYDHLGFRTLNTHCGEQPEGIWAIRHIFDCLGYHAAGKYAISKKNLKAMHFEPEIAGLPKIYVSQLEVSQLPTWAQHLMPDVISDTPYLLSDAGIELLARLKQDGVLTMEAAEILQNELSNYFRRPWNPPPKETVLKLNDVSHYAAWVLLHGNAPSHFAVLINTQEVAAWPNLETTCEALKKAGLPVKEKVEGKKDSLLQQSATYAVKEDVEVLGDDGLEKIPWTYAYLELIRRGYIEEDGQQQLYQGFIDNQERYLYNMTRTLDN